MGIGVKNWAGILVTLVVLLTQVWVGCARGQAVCIPLRDCGGHDPVEMAGGTDDACCSGGHDHHRPLVPPPAPAHDDCGCCVHVPAWDGPQRAEVRAVEIDPALTVAAAWAEPPASLVPAPSRKVAGRPPDRGGAARSSGLRVTRLLI
jgi:hypothetical protein